MRTFIGTCDETVVVPVIEIRCMIPNPRLCSRNPQFFCNPRRVGVHGYTNTKLNGPTTYFWELCICSASVPAGIRKSNKVVVAVGLLRLPTEAVTPTQ